MQTVTLPSPYAATTLEQSPGVIKPELDLDTAIKILEFFQRIRDEKRTTNPGVSRVVEYWEKLVAGWPESYETLKEGERQRRDLEEARAAANRDNRGPTVSLPRPNYFGRYSLVAKDATAHVSGLIDSDTTWSYAESPYIVEADVTVAEGATLTIEAGVSVRLQTDAGLYIHGTLCGLGSNAQRILFTSDQPSPEGGDWETIDFGNSSENAVYDDQGNWVSGSILRYCMVEYATRGVTIEQAAPFLEHCLIQNCIIEDASWPGRAGGAGVLISGSDSTLPIILDDCEITANQSDNDGGGLAIVSGYCDIRGGKIHHNNAYTSGGLGTCAGGGISHSGGWLTGGLTVTDCEIYDNRGGDGGGIYVDGIVNVERCNIHDNVAYVGGGIYGHVLGRLNVENSAIYDNVTQNWVGPGYAEGPLHGGGIFSTCNSTIRACDIYGNLSDAGGGVSLRGGGQVGTVVGCRIHDNVAIWGGGVYCWARSHLQDSQISANEAYSAGGGYYECEYPAYLDAGFGAPHTANKCVFSANSSSLHGGVLVDHAVVNLSNCLFFGNAGDISGAVSSIMGEVNLLNCTLADNLGISQDSVGFWRQTSTAGATINTIISGHADNYAPTQAYDYTGAQQHTLFFDQQNRVTVAYRPKFALYDQSLPLTLWHDLNGDLETDTTEFQNLPAPLGGGICLVSSPTGHMTLVYPRPAFYIWVDSNDDFEIGDDEAVSTGLQGNGGDVAFDSEHRLILPYVERPSGMFKLWHDADGDGIDEAGEVVTIAESVSGMSGQSLAFDKQGLLTVAFEIPYEIEPGFFTDQLLLWHDDNGDFSPQLDEIRIILASMPGGGTRPASQLTFDAAGRAILLYSDARFAGEGLKVWRDGNGNWQQELGEVQVLVC